MKFNWKIVRSTAAVMGLVVAGAAIADNGSVVLARMGNGETITEQDLSEFLSRRLDMRQAGDRKSVV